MRNFRRDPHAPAGWSAVWAVEDRMKYLPPDAVVHLRCTDLTADAEAAVAEAWVDAGLFGGSPDWIPRLMIRRKTDTPPLQSCFVAVIDPYEREPVIQAIQRGPVAVPGEQEPSDFNGVITLDLRDGRRHVMAFVGSPRPDGGVAKAAGLDLRFQADVCFLSERGNQIERLVLCNGSSIQYKGFELRLREPAAFLEISLDGSSARIESCEKPPVIETLQSTSPDGKTMRYEVSLAGNDS